MFNWTAIISALVSVGTMASVATGHPALGAVISDPNTAAALTGLIGVVGGVVSAFSQGVQHPATSVTVPAPAVNLAALPAEQAQAVAKVAAKS
jgi:hypothetical protein